MITDPAAIHFANESVRPLAEKVRALVVEINAVTPVWYAGMNAKFPNDSTVLDDGRGAEGVSVLTGADVTNLIVNLIAIATAADTNVISKPCVRALSAS